MKRILLDTGGYTALLAGDGGVLQALAQAETVYMSIFVLGELYAGFRGGAGETRNRELLASFLSRPTVKILHATQDTAEVFGTVKHTLRRAATPIPINDVWIASHAIEIGAQLVTYDKHFKKVQGLLLWDKL